MLSVSYLQHLSEVSSSRGKELSQGWGSALAPTQACRRRRVGARPPGPLALCLCESGSLGRVEVNPFCVSVWKPDILIS